MRSGHRVPAVVAAPAVFLALALGAVGVRAQDTAAGEAEKLVKAQKWEEAQRAIEPVARAEPQNAPAQYWLGRALYGRKDFSGARAAFERAVALSPDDADYHYWLGRALGMQALHASVFSRLSLARRAKKEFQRAVALDPSSWQAHEALVDYDLKAPGIAGGSKEEALSEADALKRIDPYRGSFQVERVLLATGNKAAALAEMQALAAAYPDSAEPAAHLARLRQSQDP